MALVLSERGVGSLEAILRMRSDLVMDAWAFAQYRVDWTVAEELLNRREEKK